MELPVSMPLTCQTSLLTRRAQFSPYLYLSMEMAYFESGRPTTIARLESGIADGVVGR